MRILRWIINIPRLRVVSVEFGNEFQVNSKWARPSCIPTDLREIFSSEWRVSRCPENQQQQQPFVVSGLERETGPDWPVVAAWAPGLGWAELSWCRAGPAWSGAGMRLSHSALVPGCGGSEGHQPWAISQSWHRRGNYVITQEWNQKPGNMQTQWLGVPCHHQPMSKCSDEKKVVIRDEWFLMVWVSEHRIGSLLSIILSSHAITSSVGVKRLILFNIFLTKNCPTQQIWTAVGNDIYWLITLEFLP